MLSRRGPFPAGSPELEFMNDLDQTVATGLRVAFPKKYPDDPTVVTYYQGLLAHRHIVQPPTNAWSFALQDDYHDASVAAGSFEKVHEQRTNAPEAATAEKRQFVRFNIW